MPMFATPQGKTVPIKGWALRIFPDGPIQTPEGPFISHFIVCPGWAIGLPDKRVHTATMLCGSAEEFSEELKHWKEIGRKVLAPNDESECGHHAWSAGPYGWRCSNRECGMDIPDWMNWLHMLVQGQVHDPRRAAVVALCDHHSDPEWEPDPEMVDDLFVEIVEQITGESFSPPA